MFEKILIANRGEIACRVIRTARRMGIKTVAVFSEADRGALHVEMADEAVAIGPAPAAESYLVIERVIEAARRTGAQAIHPGFGFLAENPAFVEAVEAAGLVFIGPAKRAIQAMGDKIESKRLAAEAGVSTVPGHMGLIEDDAEAVRIAREIGYPVMIKASAGGGGKGMRIAKDDAEAKEGFRSARSEAKSSFGDERIFIEKFIEQPRHIEIQVLADSHGTVLHLGERECSIQRRHQKVIEEAPSPLLDAETRAAMGAQAVALAEAVDYRSAGTVEFIADNNKNFYFLEMNTRIQVEHPVTEMVTGLDLVEWMIRIADGERLAIGQEDVRLRGWSIEARVYAEDPQRNFMPSIGRLVRYREPSTGPRLRVDSGVTEGSEISMYYDPMIAKVVSFGETRDAAVRELRSALDSFYIRGINHNIGFLTAVLEKERFERGDLTTDFIAEEFPGGFHAHEPEAAVSRVMTAVAAVLATRDAERDTAKEGGAWDWTVRHGEAETAVSVRPTAEGHRLALGDEELDVLTDWAPGEPLFRGRVDGAEITVQVDRRGPRWILSHRGATVACLAVPPHVARLAARMPEKTAADLSGFVLSPMPGLLVKLFVEPGQDVKNGEEVAIVEAMKMENVLRAQRDGVVVAVHADVGANLSLDQKILELGDAG